MKNLTERAKEFANKNSASMSGYVLREESYTSGALAERKRIVELIESQIDLLSSEIESECLSKLGVSNNEIRIKVLTRVLTKINEDA